MVNDKNNSKKQILDILRNNSETVSGQKISDKMKISRVAVWKQIKSLQELGYNIEGTPKGYILREDQNDNFLYSWEFDRDQTNYHTYRELDSTMETARGKAEKGCPGYTTVIAQLQNDGRGRGNNQWISREGGLYFTSVLRPELPSAYHYIYTLAATAVICEIFNNLYHIKAQTKWPNDVLIKGRKISGVLTELHMTGDVMTWLNLGVGINVNNSPVVAKSSSLFMESGIKQDRRELLTSFEKRFKSLLTENTPGEIRNYWKQYSATVNRKILLKTAGGRVLKGIAESIDESGSLIIRNEKNIGEQALFGDLYLK